MPAADKPATYYIDPFGCAKNQVDAENMMAHLNSNGWKSAPAEEADIIIVNSCGFIKSAKQESIDAVLEWKKLYPEKKIILAGCLAMRYETELKDILPEIDEFCKFPRAETSNHRFAKRRGRTEAIKTGERPLLSLPGSAYVKISDGCNNNCSYCAIPLIRGKLKSRTIPDIVEECKTLLKRGIKELCIVGQDIASFGTDRHSSTPHSPLPIPYSELPDLLTAISKIEQQNFWVRLLYIHPDHFPLGILDIMKKDARFLPYFDIPFQHASEKILRAMNRRVSADLYLKLIKTIRARLPLAVIRSTFLLGFPGETEEDFASLLDFQKKAKLDWLGCFAYSREEGTPAFSMKNQVPKKTAQARKREIEEAQIPITEKQLKRFVGKNRIVLIEEKFDNSDESAETFWLGRLYCHAPEIDGSAVILTGKKLIPGTFVPCKVVAQIGFDFRVLTLD